MELKDNMLEIEIPYGRYKKHLQGLVNFGSMSKYMMDKYLKYFINREHVKALEINKRPYSMVEAIIDNIIDMKEWEKNEK